MWLKYRHICRPNVVKAAGLVFFCAATMPPDAEAGQRKGVGRSRHKEAQWAEQTCPLVLSLLTRWGLYALPLAPRNDTDSSP